MKKISVIFIIGLFLFSCNDNLTKVDDDSKTTNEIGKISFKIDMTKAPSDVVSIVGIISRSDYLTVKFHKVVYETLYNNFVPKLIISF